MLTNKQIKEAIEQMKTHCDLAYHDNYRMLSARGCLYELGYEADCEQILKALYDNGFSYCLDSSFRTKDGEYVSDSVCYWGPDQLKSRLWSVHI